MIPGTLRCGVLAVAPQATFTRLPFGGAVLVDGRTLDLLECDEQLTELISALIGPPPARLPSYAETTPPGGNQVTQLIREGWLVPATRAEATP